MTRMVAAMLAVSVVALPAAARSHVGNHTITVDANAFNPRELRIDPGETVTWSILQEGHTITADDGSFDLRGPGGGTIPAGETRQWSAPPTDLRVAYHCAVHVAMIGVIIVGDPPPPPPPPREPVELRRVPLDFPSIEAALTGIPARVRVEVDPGVYQTQGITIRPASGVDPRADVVIEIVGNGASPVGVALEPAPGARATGIGVGASHVSIEHLTVRGFGTAIALAGVTDVTVRNVVADGIDHGVRATGSSNVRLDGVTTRGASVAGVAIERCGVCDVFATGLLSTGNLTGIAVTDAGSVVIHGSDVRDNATGIVLRSALTAIPRERGVHIVDNLIASNQVARPPAGGQIPLGAGVWIDGAWSVVVEDNVITSQRWGVIVTGLSGPVVDGRISGNAVEGHERADLAWDGLGAQTCFAANGGPLVTEPPLLESLYPCDRAVIGVPYPLVTLAVTG